jgi:hypothetical protein
MSTHQHPVPQPTLDPILAIGEARTADEARGGRLLASFGDFCWATSREPSLDLFDLWLAEVHPDTPATDDVTRARSAIGGVR